MIDKHRFLILGALLAWNVAFLGFDAATGQWVFAALALVASSYLLFVIVSLRRQSR